MKMLRSFNMCNRMLEFQIVVSSSLYFEVVCWWSSTGKRDINKLNKWIWKAGQVISYSMETFKSVRDRKTLNKLLSIRTIHSPYFRL